MKKTLKDAQSSLPPCPVTQTISLIGGKWKPIILYYLITGPKRFSVLKRYVHGINERMLTRQLKELVEDELIIRTDYQKIPPHVDYRLSEKGTQLLPILTAMEDWGNSHMKSLGIELSDRPEELQ